MLRHVVHFIIWCLFHFNALLHLPVRIYYKCQRPKRLPPVYDDIFFMSAQCIAEKIRKQELKSTHVVRAYITRAEQVHRVCNVIVEERFEAAMAEAARADAFAISSGFSVDELREKYPLMGVPVTIKESLAVAGMSCAAGSALRPQRAERDAIVVQSLRNAGAIVLLVSTTSEKCMNWETFSYAHGRSLNPYDTRRTCGGSSGGEWFELWAVLMAGCGSLIGIGSDLAGSARLPPSYCGVYGHRTCGATVSSDLHLPFLDHTALTLGPITRFAVDLPLVLKCIRSEQEEINDDEEVEPHRIRVYYKFGSGSDYPTSSVNSEIVDAMKRVVQHLKDDGFYTKEAELNMLSDQFDIACLGFLSIDGMYEIMTYSNASMFGEILRHLTCRPRVALPVILFAVMHFFYRLLISDAIVERNRKRLADLRAAIEETLGDDGVLLYPTMPNVASVHSSIYANMLNTCYLSIFNVLDMPVTDIPIGRNLDGMPIGIQVIAKNKNDYLTMAFARYMEMSFGGWSPPPSTKTQCSKF